eukprot:69312-Rhodomonas_salina.2
MSQDPQVTLSAYAMSGTDLAYGVICLRSLYAVSGTDLEYAATHVRRGVRWDACGVGCGCGRPRYLPTRLLRDVRVCCDVRCPMSPTAQAGTEFTTQGGGCLAFDFLLLLPSFAMSSTERGDPCPVLVNPIHLRARYALSGTETSYDPTQPRTVLLDALGTDGSAPYAPMRVLRDVRYCCRRSCHAYDACYAMSSINTGYVDTGHRPCCCGVAQHTNICCVDTYTVTGPFGLPQKLTWNSGQPRKTQKKEI